MIILQDFAQKLIINLVHRLNCCPLVWMIHNRKLNKKINKTHERPLGIVYSDHKTSFSELLKIDKSVTIHKTSFSELLKIDKSVTIHKTSFSELLKIDKSVTIHKKLFATFTY